MQKWSREFRNNNKRLTNKPKKLSKLKSKKLKPKIMNQKLIKLFLFNSSSQIYQLVYKLAKKV